MITEVPFAAAPSDWSITTLGDLCDEGGGDIQTGPFGSQLHAGDYVNDGIPSIMPQDLVDGRIDTADIARIREEDAIRLARYRVRKGDIVYSRRGDIRRRALIRDEHEGWLCGTGCLRVRLGHSANRRFINAYLGHPGVQQWIERHAVGATMPNLNTSILSSVPVLLPSRSEQDRIAAVLNTLDDKFDSNRRLAALLEQTAAELFRARFVDFVGVEEFEDSEIGAMPRTWKTGTVRDLARLKYGKALKAADRLPGPAAVVGSSGVVGTHNASLIKGPVVVVGRKGTAGSVIWVTRDAWPIDTTFVADPADGVDKIFLYFMLLHANLPHLVADSAVPGLNREAAEQAALFIPPEHAISEFASIAEPLFDHKDQLLEEKETLVAVRDLLLPKLISGEIRVPDTADPDEVIGPASEQLAATAQ